MSDNIVIYKPKVPDVQSEQVERIESTDKIVPGMYWECHLTPVFNEDDDMRTRRENYWMKEIQKGDLCLLTDYACDEHNVVHNVTLLMPPEHQSSLTSTSGMKMLVSDLYKYFSPCENGEQIRKEQLEKVMGELSETQKKITDINSDPRLLMKELQSTDDKTLIEARERLSTIKALPSPDAGKAVTSINSASNAKEELLTKIEIAKTTGLVLKKITEDLQQTAMRVGIYHGEVGHLAMARTKEARDMVDRVTSAVASLDIYLGKDIEIVEVTRGASGDPEETYKLYQNMLFIDEETLINCAGGGADYHDIQKFFDMLGTDATLLERIFPYERCIIIIRPRRRNRTYDGASPFESAQRNYRNSLSFLMVRNGENVTAIFHPMDFLTKLFPSLSDMDNAFVRNGWGDCRNVTRDDIEFTSSLEAVENIKRQYKRVVLMLQGILERDEGGQIFGGFPGGMPMLLNPADQARVFEFVSLENAIEDDRRPSYEKWFAGLNKDIRVGSLVSLKGLFLSNENTPGAFTTWEYGKHSFQNYDIDKSFFETPQIIEKHGKFIGFKRVFTKRHHEDKTCLIRLMDDAIRENKVIDLEKVRSDDITFYLNSRKYRQSYEDYIQDLLHLRHVVSLEEERTAVIREVVTQTLRDAGKEVDDALVFQAVMKYRADNNGELRESVIYKKDAMKAIMNVYWQLSGGGDEMADKICDYFGRENVALIVSNTKNKMSVYVMDPAKALDFDESGFPWFSRYTLENPKTMRFSGPKPARATDIRGKVTYIYRAERYDEIKSQQTKLHGLSYQQYRNVFDKIYVPENIGGRFAEDLQLIENALSGGSVSKEVFEKLFKKFTQYNEDLRYRDNYPSSVSLPILNFPIGYVRLKDDGYTYRKTRYRLARISIDLIDVLGSLFSRVEAFEPDMQGWQKHIIREVHMKTNRSNADKFSMNGKPSKTIDGLSFGASEMEETSTGLHSFYISDGNPAMDAIHPTKTEGVLELDGSIIEKAFGLSVFAENYPHIARTALCHKTFSSRDVNTQISVNDFLAAFTLNDG